MKFSEVIRKGITVGVVSAFILVSGSNYVSATSGQFNDMKKVDSNEWTEMKKTVKSTDYQFAAIKIDKMYEANYGSGTRGSVSSEYKKLYARLSSDGKSIIKEFRKGGGSYDSSNGRITLENGRKTTFLIKDKYKYSNTPVRVLLMGCNPAKDCYVDGSWNIDRSNDNL